MSSTTDTGLCAVNLDHPDERRTMGPGVLDIAKLPGAMVVRATFEPGWKWSTDAGPAAGTASCQQAHIGVVMSGRFHVEMDDGTGVDLGPGDAHAVAPGHDAWVVGDEPVVVLDIATTPDGHSVACPCGVEFHVADDAALDHLMAAVREHAAGSHGQDVSDDHIREHLAADA